MYVCACKAVTDRTVRAALAAGAHSVEDVTRRCGAGSECGGCLPLLQELLATLDDGARPRMLAS
ncbi:MAG TPA: (2Fe-2S)-binding protein [Acidimicrobiales bacterium]|nr:(2Fe-2S)-binding protein [Acidimicrobiales bacterium]